MPPPTEPLAGGRWWRQRVSSSPGAAKDFHCPGCLAASSTAPWTHLLSTPAALADRCSEAAEPSQERLLRGLDRPAAKACEAIKSSLCFKYTYLHFVFLGGGGAGSELAGARVCWAPQDWLGWSTHTTMTSSRSSPPESGDSHGEVRTGSFTGWNDLEDGGAWSRGGRPC